MNRFDVIVIGSGIGGLSAALTSQRAGCQVLLLEAGQQFGGYLNPFRRGLYDFDPGLHYIGECGPEDSFTRLLQSLGLDAEVTFRELCPAGFDRLIFPTYQVDTPRGVLCYRERLLKDFPQERKGLDRFFSLVRLAGQASSALTGPWTGAGTLALMRAAPRLAPYAFASYKTLLDSCLSDPLLKAVLAAQGGDLGLPPSRASALLSLGVLEHYLRHGAYYPVGGSRALRNAFIRALRMQGAVLQRNSPVAQILASDGKVRGVRLANGTTYYAPAIISNAAASITYGELLAKEHVPKRLLAKAERIRPSLSSMTAFIGTDLDLSACGLSDANIWHFASPDIDALYEPAFAHQMPRCESFFLSSPSLKDPTSAGKAPSGHHTLEVVAFASYEPFSRWAQGKTLRRGPEYEAIKKQWAAQCVQAVEQYVPGLRAHIQVLEVGTPVTNQWYVRAPFGGLYGPEQSPDQMGPFRFSIRGGLEGLYLCGASTLSAGIVPCALSGHQAGQLAAAQVQASRKSWVSFQTVRELLHREAHSP